MLQQRVLGGQRPWLLLRSHIPLHSLRRPFQMQDTLSVKLRIHARHPVLEGSASYVLHPATVLELANRRCVCLSPVHASWVVTVWGSGIVWVEVCSLLAEGQKEFACSDRHGRIVRPVCLSMNL